MKTFLPTPFPILPVPPSLPPVTQNHYNYILIGNSKGFFTHKLINTDIYSSPTPCRVIKKEKRVTHSTQYSELFLPSTVFLKDSSTLVYEELLGSVFTLLLFSISCLHRDLVNPSPIGGDSVYLNTLLSTREYPQKH